MKKILSIIILLLFVFSIPLSFAVEGNANVNLKANENTISVDSSTNVSVEDIDSILEEMQNVKVEDNETAEIEEELLEKEAPKGFGLFWTRIKAKISFNPETKFDMYVKIATSHLVNAKRYYALGEKEKSLKELENFKETLKELKNYVEKLKEENEKNPNKKTARKIVVYEKKLDLLYKALERLEERIKNSNLSEKEKQKILPFLEESKKELKNYKGNFTKVRLKVKAKLNISDEEEIEFEEKAFSNYGQNVSTKVIIKRTEAEYLRVEELVKKITEKLEDRNLTEEQEKDLNETLTLLEEANTLLEEARTAYEKEDYTTAKEKAKEAHKKIIEALKIIAKYNAYIKRALFDFKKERPVLKVPEDLKERLKERNERLEKLRELREKVKERYEEKVRERVKERMEERNERLKEITEEKVKERIKNRLEERKEYEDKMKKIADETFNVSDDTEVGMETNTEVEIGMNN